MSSEGPGGFSLSFPPVPAPVPVQEAGVQTGAPGREAAGQAPQQGTWAPPTRLALCRSVRPSIRPPPRSGQFSGQRFFFPPDVTTQMAPGVSARAPPNTAVLSSVTRVSPMTT